MISVMVAILMCAFHLGVCGVCLVALWWLRQKAKTNKRKAVANVIWVSLENVWHSEISLKSKGILM